VHVVGLWFVLAILRWLAALPVRQPRIFRDELLHWQLAQSFVTHRPFLVSGEVVDYPAPAVSGGAEPRVSTPATRMSPFSSRTGSTLSW
jgi:hypothetical protein